ncbi:MAG: hypothetical protein HKN41_08755, partial [Ilumatobacter sp.]|nr:hypothetical protein [Ilumatobacter sp.]
MPQMYDVDVREQHLRTVDFVCPRCGLDRVGTELQPRRWMMAFHLPIAPLGDLPRVVRCDECEHVADLGILDVPTTDQLVDLLELATVAAMVIAVRSTTGERVQAVSDGAVRLLSDSGYDVDHRRLAALVARTSTLDALDDVRRLRTELTPHGKQNFLHRLTSVAMVGGSLTSKQREGLLTVGRALGMALPHVHG